GGAPSSCLRRPHAAHPASPAAAGAARDPGPRGLGEPRRAGVRVPAAVDPAGGGVRRSFVLRPVRARATRGRRPARLRRHRVLARRGRAAGGGAAFPTGRKWQSVADAPVRPHYLVCNADESEPGTFKDRVLMEGDPFALVEGMAIAAFATGCEKGYVYVRAEYPLARRRVENAIALARERGYLDFEIEVRRGAGAYICGEETALFNS